MTNKFCSMTVQDNLPVKVLHARKSGFCLFVCFYFFNSAAWTTRQINVEECSEQYLCLSPYRPAVGLGRMQVKLGEAKSTSFHHNERPHIYCGFYPMIKAREPIWRSGKALGW